MKPPVLIYHITHIENLRGILEEGRLWAKNLLPRLCTSIAYEHIQEERAQRTVPVGPGGVLHDYVPFYFCPRSPMLYALHNPVEGQMHYRGGQRPILHIVSSVERVEQAGLPFVFTDRHAKKKYADFFTQKADFARLDWQAIRARRWFDTPEQPYRKEKKQAELLVHRFFPWELVEGIGVLDSGMARGVRQVLEAFPKAMWRTVWVKRDWYY